MSGKRSRSRRPRTKRQGRGRKGGGETGSVVETRPLAPVGPQDGAGQGRHVIEEMGEMDKLVPVGHPGPMIRSDCSGAIEGLAEPITTSPELVLVTAMELGGYGASCPDPALAQEVLRLQEVQLCLEREQLLLEDRRRQIQLQLQLEEQLWREEQLWQEEQRWLEQLQEEHAWVRMEGIELALELEQLRTGGFEEQEEQVHGQVMGSPESFDPAWGIMQDLEA